MFLINNVEDKLKSSVTLQEISNYNIFEINITRNKMIFNAEDIHYHKIDYDFNSFIDKLNCICKINIDSLIFYISGNDFYIEIFGESLHLVICNLSEIFLNDLNNLFKDSRFLSDIFRKNIVDYLYKEIPLFFTISYY